MAKYGDIEITDGMRGFMVRCGTCKKPILVEERHNGTSRTMARFASHWDCLTLEQQAAAAQHYRLTEIV